MARVTLDVKRIGRSGVSATPVVGSADGQQFSNDGRTFLAMVNGTASDVDVTVVTTRTVLGLDVDDLAVTVPANGSIFSGPFPTSDFNNAGDSSGLAYVNFATGSESSVSVAAYRV